MHVPHAPRRCRTRAGAATAFFARLGPALLATFLSVVTIEFVFLPPQMSAELHEARDLVILCTFAGIALAVSWLAEQLEDRRESMERVARRTPRRRRCHRVLHPSPAAPERLI